MNLWFMLDAFLKHFLVAPGARQGWLPACSTGARADPHGDVGSCLGSVVEEPQRLEVLSPSCGGQAGADVRAHTWDLCT